MLCNECTQSVYESIERDTLDINEACVEIFTRHNWLWPEIILIQGKYTVEILKNFGMKNCKSMPTPMVMNLKNLSETSFDSGKIDPHLYRQLIG